MTVNLSYTTPCGHEAKVKLCQSKNGPNAGRWVVNIRGPKITKKNRVKTKYCAPSEAAAKQAIASTLGISESVIVSGNSSAAAVVKKEDTKTKTATTNAMHAAPFPKLASHPPFPQQTPPMNMMGTEFPGIMPQAYPSQPFHADAAFGPPPPPAAFCQPHRGGMMSMPPAVPSASLPPVGMTMPPVVPSAVSSIMPSSVASAAVPSANATAPHSQVVATNGNASSSLAMIPTIEQERIYQHAKPPTPLDTNFTVRITAGAGAGKTTTVLQVAARAAQLGHSHITYLTFAKAAAVDGARRIQEALSGFPNPPVIEARTLHSCAMKLLADERAEAFQEVNGRLMDDEALQTFIKNVCSREIDEFLLQAKEEIASRTKSNVGKGASMLEAAERQVSFFIFKVFSQFCCSPYTLEQLKDPTFRYRNYYPAELFHQEGKDGEKQGFPSMVYKFKVGRYADLACLVWDAATQQGIRGYDMEMKRAQLKALRIPGSLLLVDESQDMDGCQVNWVSQMCKHGTHVYIVGDAAQTIYSFRGAKSKYMVQLKGATDFELTKSWRFGANIASIANIVLFSKHKSKQTSRDKATWQPYRVKGGGRDGKVTADPILWKWKEGMPITIIAAFNATLLQTAASMLGMNIHSEGSTSDEDVCLVKTEQEENMDSSSVNSQATSPVPIVSNDTCSPSLAQEGTSDKASGASEGVTSVKEEALSVSFPKIHINGSGENSGLKKWKSVLKQIQHIYDLYRSGDDGYVLPARTFKEFNGERITWNTFTSIVESREMTKYMSTIHIVSTCGDRTNDVMALFEREVMDKKYSVEEADVILSTTHAAKGMEWDNVHVCDDYADIFKLSCDGPLTSKRGSAGSNAKRTSWQFHIKSWGDDVNLLYVACTRARKLLSIPASLKTFIQDCDMLHDMIRFKKLFREQDMTKSSDIVVFGRQQPLSVQDALDVYQDIVLPLRMENNLQTKQRLMKALVKPLDDEEKEYEDEKAMDIDNEFEQFFGYQQKPAPASVATPASSVTIPATNVPSPVVAASSAVKSEAGSAAKKQKLSRAHYIMDEAKKCAALAPTGITRPYDKREVAARSAKCRECGSDITVGVQRVGIQVYKTDKSEFWCSYFHETCFPKELLPQLRLDPNRNRKKPAKKSWTSKKSYGGGGYKKKYWGGGGWKKGGGYRKRWN